MTADLKSAIRPLDGKVAVVLGASAQAGTGWAIAEMLAQHGARVVVGARSEAPLQQLAELTGGIAVRCDVGVEEDVRSLARKALDAYGKLDIAVNAAGQPVMGLISDLTQCDLDKSVAVNFFGNVYFVKHMAEAIGTDGSVTILSSMATTHPLIPHAAYACAKSATDCLVRYAAIEYGPRRIRVNSILPGSIRSDMSREAFTNPAFERAMTREVPLGRVGEPRDFANAVMWLAEATYVTGLNLQLNGGNHLTRFPRLDELQGGEKIYGSGKVIGDRLS